MMETKDIIEKAIKEARGKRPGIIISRDDIYNAIFKAGRDSFLDDVGNATIPLSEAHKAGRKEVVEWMEQDCDCEHRLIALHKQCRRNMIEMYGEGYNGTLEAQERGIE